MSDPYEAAIRQFVGLKGEPPEIHEARKALLRARDWSSRVVGNPMAYPVEVVDLHSAIVRLSCAWAYRLDHTQLLPDAVDLARRLGRAATLAQRLASADCIDLANAA